MLLASTTYLQSERVTPQAAGVTGVHDCGGGSHLGNVIFVSSKYGHNNLILVFVGRYPLL